jgi:secreted Zn-dependent insulinase-like peptidase
MIASDAKAATTGAAIRLVLGSLIDPSQLPGPVITHWFTAA